MVGADAMKSMRFAFHTGEGFNIVRRLSLPPGWQDCIDYQTVPSLLKEANGYPLGIGEITWLTYVLVTHSSE